MQDEYKNALEDDMDLNEKIVKLGELNELAYEILFCLSTPVPLFEKWHLNWYEMRRV